MENSASLTRAPVGLVASPGGALSERPPSRPATTRTPAPAGDARSSRRLDLAPHLPAHALPLAILAGDDARCAPGRHQLAFLTQPRQHRLANQERPRHGATHGFARQLQIAG